MNTDTIQQPARGLVHPNFDPRPCVTKPAQWWDLGDEHNPRAIRYCRNVCPLRKECHAEISEETKPKGQIRAGHPYNEYGKRLTVCADCDTPRTRIGTYGTPTCGCTPKHLRIAIAAASSTASAEAAERWKASKDKAARTPSTVMVDLWLPLYAQGMTVASAARQLGISPNTLKSALRTARKNGDTRVPVFQPGPKPQAVAA